jgi:hypothetical protein
MKKFLLIICIFMIVIFVQSCKETEDVYYDIVVESHDEVILTLDKYKARYKEIVHYSYDFNNTKFDLSINLVYNDADHYLDISNLFFEMPDSDVLLVCRLTSKSTYIPKPIPTLNNDINPNTKTLELNSFKDVLNSITPYSFENVVVDYFPNHIDGIYYSYYEYSQLNIDLSFDRELFEDYYVVIITSNTEILGGYPILISAFYENTTLELDFVGFGDNSYPVTNGTNNISAFVFEKIHFFKPLSLNSSYSNNPFIVKGTVVSLYFKGRGSDYSSDYVNNNIYLNTQLLDKYPLLKEYEINLTHNHLTFHLSNNLIEKDEFESIFKDILHDDDFVYYELENTVSNYYYSSLNNIEKTYKSNLFSVNSLIPVVEGQRRLLISSYVEFFDLFNDDFGIYDEAFFSNYNLYVIGDLNNAYIKDVIYQDDTTIIEICLLNVKTSFSKPSITLPSESLFIPILKNNDNPILVNFVVVHTNKWTPSKLYAYQYFEKEDQEKLLIY